MGIHFWVDQLVGCVNVSEGRGRGVNVRSEGNDVGWR